MQIAREQPVSWQEAWDQLTHVTDALGRPIDPGIFETVVALTVVGFHTTMSCEGHLDHGIAAPWVDIEPKEAEALRRQISAVQRQSTQEIPSSGSRPLEDAAKVFSDQLKADQMQTCKDLMLYLAHFYEGRSVPYDQVLIASSKGKAGRFRLESLGMGLQALHPLEIRADNLQRYQKEMRDFTAFLKRSARAQMS
jgi:hypothetical protein